MFVLSGFAKMKPHHVSADNYQLLQTNHHQTEKRSSELLILVPSLSKDVFLGTRVSTGSGLFAFFGSNREVKHHVYVNLYHVTKFPLCLSPTAHYFYT